MAGMLEIRPDTPYSANDELRVSRLRPTGSPVLTIAHFMCMFALEQGHMHVCVEQVQYRMHTYHVAMCVLQMWRMS